VSSGLRLRVALCVVALACSVAAAASARGDSLSPACSLYGVTLASQLLTSEFDSPNLTYNPKKWPTFLQQANNARAVFDDSRFASARPRYDALIHELGIVNAKLSHGDRGGARRELRRAAVDLKAVLAAARSGHLVCKSGSTVFSIG